MDPPTTDIGPNHKVEGTKEQNLLFKCDLCDTEVVHKTAQVILPGLATACVDNTTGDMFKSPASVAADVRKEMVEYLIQRSETVVAESLIQDPGADVLISYHPTDIIADLVDDFASTKQNLFSRVSGWLLSEKREDKIDDFIQEMELNKFWSIDRRETVVQTLLRNVDYTNKYHCTMKFDAAEELDKHKKQCIYRSMNCTNEGCSARFGAMHIEKHDLACPFKILPCEQKCSAGLMRREMDRHCITVCPMKLMNCPFYSVGCQSTVPQCHKEQHCAESLHHHVWCILKTIHKEASMETLEHRVELLEQLTDLHEMCDIEDLRFLSRTVKRMDAQMGPLKHYVPSTVDKEGNESIDMPQHPWIQGQTSQEPILHKSDAEIQAQASKEPRGQIEEAGIQVQTSQEPTIDKLAAESQVHISSTEPRAKLEEAGIQMQTSEEPMINILETVIQVLSSREPSDDKSQEPIIDKTEIQGQTSTEPRGEVQAHTSSEPGGDKSDLTSYAPIIDKLETETKAQTTAVPRGD